MAGELPDDVKATLSILEQPQAPPPVKLKPTRTMDDIALPIPPQRPQDDIAQTLSILDGNPPPEVDASAPNPRDIEADVLKLALRKGVNSNTALAAQRKAVAQKLNIAPDLVTPQAEETAFYQDHDPTDLQKNYPALAKYLGVQGNAELVGKNIDPLKEVETFYRRSENDPAIGMAKGVVSVAQAVVGLGDLVSLGKAGKYIEEKGLDLKKIQGVLNDLYTTESQKLMRDVGDAKGFWNTVGTALRNPSTIGLMTVESLPQMYLGGRVIGGALKAAFPALSFGAAGAIGEGVTMAGGSAEQIRSSTDTGELTGKQTALSLGVGVLGTGLSALGNKLATRFGFEDPDADVVAGKLLNKLQDSGVPKPLAVRIIGGAAIEGGVEEMPQSIVEQVAQNVALDRPWNEGVENAAAIGLITGGAMGAGFQLAAAGRGRQSAAAVAQETPAEKQARTVVQNTITKTAAAVRAEDQRNALSEWGKRVATDNTLRKESPESFKDFVRTMADEDDAVKEVFVDAKLLNETLAQAGIDQDQLAKEMPDVAESLGEALATNGEVRIPIEDYAAHIVGTPVENAILDHLRTTPDGMTYAESQVFFQQQQADFIKQAENLINLNEPVLTRKEFMAQAPAGMQYKDYLQAHKNKVEAFATDLQDVHDSLLAGLESTGRFPKSISRVYAIPFREFYATNAARMGVMPSELYKNLPLNFAKMSTADILNQAPEYKGHLINSGGLQGHSLGELYPYMVVGRQNGYQLLNGSTGELYPIRGDVTAAIADRPTGPAKISDFSKSNVKNIMNRTGWMIMSAWNPNNQTQSKAKNDKAHARLLAELKRLGLEHEVVMGRYGSDETESPSVLILGVDYKTQLRLVREYQQESVLINRGLLYQDGSINPPTSKVQTFKDADKALAKTGAYTRVPSTGTIFSIDFNGKNLYKPNEPGQYFQSAVQQPDSLTLIGVHYSKEQRSRLEGKYFGTGLPGAERDRLSAATDKRILNRVDFYVDTGDGVVPESGLGSVKHEVPLQNIYDASKNERGFRVPSTWTGMNDFESQVLDAGYDGYFVEQRVGNKKQGRVVVLGQAAESIPTEGADSGQGRNEGLLRSQAGQNTGVREADGSLQGLPRKVGEFNAKQYQKAEEITRKYMAEAGLPYNPPSVYAKINPERAKRIADAFEQMKHDPQNPEVKAAYAALAKETEAQYKAVIDSGLKVEFIDFAKTGDPYEGNPRKMTEDVINNNHMWVFSTREGFGSDADFNPQDNPLLNETDFEISGQKALVNDLFRVVHDYFGHVKEGVGFRAEGEENAWRAHMAMFSPLAGRALTAETRGQNSWVNFGPYAETNRTASAADTHYADQKIGLLPEWVSTEGVKDEVLNQSARLPETININGVERPTMNSNGKPIYPTEEGIRSFWKWFGDSKVVDEQGRPLVVYHGTTFEDDSAAFTEFDEGMIGSGIFSPGNAGFQFTDNIIVAEHYANNGDMDGAIDSGGWLAKKSEHTEGAIHAVGAFYLKSESLFEIDADAINQKYFYANSLTEILQEKQSADFTLDDWSEYLEYAGDNWRDTREFKGYFGKSAPPEIVKNLLESSQIYDGVKVNNARWDTTRSDFNNQFYVFKANQIKSATDNTGVFDPNNPNILQQSALYSALERSISGLNKLANKQGIVKTDQVEKWITSRVKDGTFKKDEVEAIGLPDFLKLKGAEVSAAEVENFVKQNGVQINETMLSMDAGGDPNPDLVFDRAYGNFLEEHQGDFVDDEGNVDEAMRDDTWEFVSDRYLTEARESLARGREPGTNFEQYTLPGGSDYRELALSLPVVRSAGREEVRRLENGRWGLFVNGERLQSFAREEDARAAIIESLTIADIKFQVPSAHKFGSEEADANRLAHVRFDTRYYSEPLSEEQQKAADKNREIDAEINKLHIGFGALYVQVRNEMRPIRAEIMERLREEALRSNDASKLAEVDNAVEEEIQKLPPTEAQKKLAEFRAREDELRKQKVEINPVNKKVLFIEEIQSDWAQQGREKGFAKLTPQYHIAYVDGPTMGAAYASREEATTELNSEFPGRSDLEVRESKPAMKGISPAPFVTDTKSWVSLVLKRMMRYAAENGFDSIAWTTGAQQSARYSLGRTVKKAIVSLKTEGRKKVNLSLSTGGVTLIVDPQGAVTDPGRFAGNKLSEVVGVELADKIMAAKEETTFSGLDLEVGGEGMKAFYDKGGIVDQVASKLAKQFGGKATRTIDMTGGKTPADSKEQVGVQPGFDITPELKAKIMQGLPLFQGNRAGFNPSTFTISLLQGADLSSVIHEGAHFYLEALADLAGRENAPQQIKDDFRTTLDWFGITGNEQGKPGGSELEQKAFHGSPHSFDKFSTANIGTGEGAQAYGYGLYFTDTKSIAEFYRKALQSNDLVNADGTPLPGAAAGTEEKFAQTLLKANSGDYAKSIKEAKADENTTEGDKRFSRLVENVLKDYKKRGVTTKAKSGAIYEVELKPNEDEYLLWDKPLSEQSEKVKAALKGAIANASDRKSARSLKAIAASDPKGETIYLALKNEYPDAGNKNKAASDYLHSIGIRGIKYLDGTSRGAGEGSYNYVIFSDNDVEIQAFYQSQQGGENQQPTTPLPPGATPEEIWSRMTLDQKRPYHEQWAQSYERYTLEGKAPTVEMQPVFARFREWMLSVYNSMKDFLAQNPLAGKLNDDIRSVFDRLIASEEKIYQAEEARGYASLFGSAAEAGLSEPEYENYQNLGKLASSRAVDNLTSRSIRDMRWLSNAKDKTIKKLQAEADSKRAAVTEQVTDEVDAMPLNRARNFLTTGEFIDEAGVRRESDTKFKLNEAEVKALTNGDVPENIKAMVSPDGVGLELAANLLGFQSPETLVDQLVNGESRDVTIQGMTDQRMLEQYGDLTDDKAIERAAEKAIHNEARARFMATGLKLLTKTELSAAQLNRAAKMAAEATIAKKKIRAINPGQFTRAEAKANREAIENVARDPKKAIDAQRAALLNNRLAKAALEAADDVDSILKYFKKFESKGVRKAIGIDQIDQIDDLLQQVNRDKNLPLIEIDKRQALADWVAEQEADGFEPVLDPVQAEQIKAKHYKDMTVDELRMLRDTVKQIEHVGRLKQTLLTEMERADFRTRVEEAENSIRANANRTVEEKGTPTDVIGETNRWVRQMLASHRKFSSFIREMDGGRDGGVMWRLLSKNMNAAGDNEVEMRRASSEAVSDLFKLFEQEKAPLNIYAKRTLIPGTNIAMTQEQRIMFGMNWGNEGNRQRLLDGGIEGKRALSIKEAEAILDTLTKPEWDFVQGVWDHIASYKDQIAALERKITGVEPEWVEPAEVKTKFGTYRGGYFPAKYDVELSTRSESYEAAVDTRMAMKGAFNSAGTRKGFTQQRSEAVVNRPLLLSYNVIANHISEVTHRLAWQPWLIDANRVLKALDAPIREHYGAEVLRELRNTVNDIAAGDVGSRTPMEKAINYLRSGSTIVGMGWRFSTAFLQPSGLAQSWARIGGRWVAKGVAETFKNLNHANELVNSKSSLMKNRDITMNREINDVLNRVRTNEGMNAITGSYFSLIGKMQRVVDLPTWFGAYEKALHDMKLESAATAEERARIESDAIALADQAVIDSQSGGQLKDLASIQRGHPGLKLFTNFYSYFSATYNLNIEAVRRTNFRSPTDIAFLAGDLILLNIVPVLFSLALKEATKGKCGDDLDCLVKAYGYEQAGYMFGQMILLRDMGSAALVAAGGDQFGYSGPAGLRFFSDLYKAGVQVNQGELDWPLFKSVSNTAGVLLHFPTGQINTTLEGIVAVENGDVDGLSILPALLFGPPKD